MTFLTLMALVWQSLFAQATYPFPGFNAPAASGITRVNTTSGFEFSGSAFGSIAATAANHTAGNCLLVGVRSGNITTVTVSDTAGNTYTERNDEGIGGVGGLRVFTAHNITGNASNVVTATFGTNQSYPAIIVHQYAGVSTTTPMAATGKANDGGSQSASATTSSFTATTSGQVAVGFTSTGSVAPGTITPGSGYTTVVDVNSVGALVSEDNFSAGVTTASQTWVNNANWVIIGITLQQ